MGLWGVGKTVLLNELQTVAEEEEALTGLSRLLAEFTVTRHRILPKHDQEGGLDGFGSHCRITWKVVDLPPDQLHMVLAGR